MQNKINTEKVSCQICGFYSVHLKSHLAKMHNLTVVEYLNKYPDAKIYHETYIASKRKAAAASNLLWGNPETRLKRIDGVSNNWKIRKVLTSQRKLALKLHPTCERCGNSDNLVVHHKDGKNYTREFGNHDLNNLLVLCNSCHSKLHRQLEKTQDLFHGQKDIEQGMTRILIGLKKQFGLDLTDENLIDTPRRVSRAYLEMFWGLKQSPEEILSTKFHVNSNGMIVWKRIKFYSTCSHHFLPFEGTCSIAILPANGEVVGISKMARLVECFTKRPQLQERINEQIADSIVKNLTPDCMVVTTATHMCMQCRGIEQDDSPLTVSTIRGKFEKQEVRMEALELMDRKI